VPQRAAGNIYHLGQLPLAAFWLPFLYMLQLSQFFGHDFSVVLFLSSRYS
jgi:hypothetical protein